MQGLARKRHELQASWGLNEFIPHDPWPLQAAALSIPDVFALLFGGAAGPGKSDFLLMDALRDPWIRIEGFAGLLLRKWKKDLVQPGGLLHRARIWLKPAIARGTAVWDREIHGFQFPKHGSTLVFGYADSDSDFEHFAGAEYQYAGIDEAVQFTRRQIAMVGSRLRRPSMGPVSKIPLRLRLGSNPAETGKENFGHDYLLEEFVEGADGKERAYLPGTIDDNPALDREVYKRGLLMLFEDDEVMVARYMRGDWRAVPGGGWFKRHKAHLMPEKPSSEDVVNQVRFWDLAGTEEKIKGDPDYTAGVLMDKMRDGFTFQDYPVERVIEDLQHFRGDPTEVETRILNQAAIDGPKVKIRIEFEPGQASLYQIDSFKKKLRGYDCDGNFVSDGKGGKKRITGNKQERARPFSQTWGAGRVAVVMGDWNEKLFRQNERFPGNVTHDDIVDGESGADIQLTGTFMPAGLRWLIAQNTLNATRVRG